MKPKKEIVLVLGASGMLGDAVYSYLYKKHQNIFGTSRKKIPNKIYFNFKNKEQISKLLEAINPTHIINCIGALEGSKNEELRTVNIELPKILSQFSDTNKYRVVNISTDAVFGDLQGKVTENSFPRPDDKYGKSKLLGEQKRNVLNIRTSIIGFDPYEHKGLLEKVMRNNDSMIGFDNQKWSGATTLQLAKFIENIIYNEQLDVFLRKTHILNFAPIISTKYKILKTFSKLMRLKTPEIKIGKVKNRILKSVYIKDEELKSYGQSLKKELINLIKFYRYGKT